jgi:hypothetical protein
MDSPDRCGVTWSLGGLMSANLLLAEHHYLGPIRAGGAQLVIVGRVANRVVAAQVWRRPTSRRLPSDGTWLELSRWCLTPEAGEHAGSRQHKAAARIIRKFAPHVTTLVSYSDPGQGHTGALYQACNWHWAPTWHRLRPPPTGNGNWGKERAQLVKDRWVFDVRPDPRRAALLAVNDNGAIRHWVRTGPTERELALARRSPAPDLSSAACAADPPIRLES